MNTSLVLYSIELRVRKNQGLSQLPYNYDMPHKDHFLHKFLVQICNGVLFDISIRKSSIYFRFNQDESKRCGSGQTPAFHRYRKKRKQIYWFQKAHHYILRWKCDECSCLFFKIVRQFKLQNTRR